MKEENKIIFVDIDDTLADTRAAVAALYKKVTRYDPLNIKEVKSKKYFEFCPLWTDEYIESFFESSRQLYSVIKPLEGAVEGIDYLIGKGYDVRVVTMHHPKSIQYKQEWIERYFPLLEHKVYYVNWRLPNKDVFKGYSLIDDDIKNIKTNMNEMPILLDFYEIYSKEEIRGLNVCKSWSEVIQKF